MITVGQPIEGNGTFQFPNYLMIAASFWSSLFSVCILRISFYWVPLLVLLWWPIMFCIFIMVYSRWQIPEEEVINLKGRSIEDYMTIKDQDLRAIYEGDKKIPMELFFESYFEDKIDIEMDCLDLFENRYDWASFEITIHQGLFFLTQFLPSLLWHSRKTDSDMVIDHYDRGNDFHRAFLGDPMVYTSGISKGRHNETIKDLQENKFDLVAKKLRLVEGDNLLDLGCGWGTFISYVAAKYKVNATGVTLAKEQQSFGYERAKDYGVQDQVHIIRKDAREIPLKIYDKISCLEMAEHVGVFGFASFMSQIRKMLKDDGLFFLQIAGLRAAWQYEDLVWGLFMNKYVFPGADASLPLNWVIRQLENTGFEVLSVETIGIHYSITIHEWYKEWIKNKKTVIQNFGVTWFRKWEVFLAWSTIIARQGSASCYQIVSHKNFNGFDRSENIEKS